MHNRLIQISALLVLFLTIGFFLGVPYFDNKEIEKNILLIKNKTQKNNISDNLKSANFKALPSNVKKYLTKGILKTDSYSTAEIKLTGKTRETSAEDWKDVTSKKTYSLVTPEFIEVSEISDFFALWEKRVSQFINGVATSKTKLLSSIEKEEHYGNQLNRAYLTKYLMESVFAPSVLLPSMNVKWRGLSNNSAEAAIWYKNKQSKVVFYFNKKNEVVKITSNDYFIPNEIDYKRVGITYHFANYKDVNYYYIPTFIEVEINLPGKKITTGRFQIKEIVYK